MIAFLRGKLIYIQDESIVVDVHGIGYEVICPNPFVFQSSLNKELFIFTYHHVRDDLQQLYGFKDEDEKYLFTKLISVSGIGPKSAIAILGRAQVGDFIAAVEREDDKYLTQFPGVGKKTARQIILDLKGKLSTHLMGEAVSEQPDQEVTLYSEISEALKSLGYVDKEIKQILPQLQKEKIEKIDQAIKRALFLLSK